MGNLLDKFWDNDLLEAISSPEENKHKWPLSQSAAEVHSYKSTSTVDDLSQKDLGFDGTPMRPHMLLDPRSPTAGVYRTPILLNASVSNFKEEMPGRTLQFKSNEEEDDEIVAPGSADGEAALGVEEPVPIDVKDNKDINEDNIKVQPDESESDITVCNGHAPEVVAEVNEEVKTDVLAKVYVSSTNDKENAETPKSGLKEQTCTPNRRKLGTPLAVINGKNVCRKSDVQHPLVKQKLRLDLNEMSDKENVSASPVAIH